MDSTLIAAMAAGISAVITAIGGYLLNNKRLMADMELRRQEAFRVFKVDEIDVLFKDLREQRQELLNRIKSNELELNRLHEANLRCSVETAELKALLKEALAKRMTMEAKLDKIITSQSHKTLDGNALKDKWASTKGTKDVNPPKV